VTGAQAAVFDDAPIAMHLAVFFAGVVAQKHIVGRQGIIVATRRGRGQVSTGGILKMGDLPWSDLRHTGSEEWPKPAFIHEISAGRRWPQPSPPRWPASLLKMPPFGLPIAAIVSFNLKTAIGGKASPRR
jgi:hypothetical protein